MRRVLEPQAIPDQAGFARLGDEFLKDLGKALDTDAFAKVCAAGMMRHGVIHRPIEKPAKRHIGGRACDDLAIRQLVVETQEQDLEHAHRIYGRPAHPHRIGFGQAWSKPLKIDGCRDFAQIMIGGDDDLEDLSIEVG